jgi:hypothetical protein
VALATIRQEIDGSLKAAGLAPLTDWTADWQGRAVELRASAKETPDNTRIVKAEDGTKYVIRCPAVPAKAARTAPRTPVWAAGDAASERYECPSPLLPAPSGPETGGRLLAYDPLRLGTLRLGAVREALAIPAAKAGREPHGDHGRELPLQLQIILHIAHRVVPKRTSSSWSVARSACIHLIQVNHAEWPTT